MEEFCVCKDGINLKKNQNILFRWDSVYGWVLNWIEITEESGYSQVHRYGISIKYCPMCGKELKNIIRKD